MPDKRQTSKQRRAARNRASRQALAARRENAVAGPEASPAPTGSGPAGGARTAGGAARAGSGRAAGAAAAGATAAGPPPRGLAGMIRSKRPGDKAVLAALVFSVVAAGMLSVTRVPVDDRGEVLPSRFRALAVAARERITGQPIDDTVSLLEAYGAGILLVLGLPIFISLFAVWGNRRPDRSRMLTFAMLGMAGAVIVTGSIAQGIAFLFYPALIALAVAGFRVRRADLPARMAERATPGGARGGRGRDRPIDVESAEAGGDAGPGRDEVEYDPLAELEAEIEAEKAAGPGDAGDEAGGDAGDAGGRGRRGRARRSG